MLSKHGKQARDGPVVSSHVPVTRFAGQTSLHPGCQRRAEISCQDSVLGNDVIKHRYRYAARHANEASRVPLPAGFCLCQLHLPRVSPILPFAGATSLFSCGVLVHVHMHVPVHTAPRPQYRRTDRKRSLPTSNTACSASLLRDDGPQIIAERSRSKFDDAGCMYHTMFTPQFCHVEQATEDRRLLQYN